MEIMKILDVSWCVLSMSSSFFAVYTVYICLHFPN